METFLRQIFGELRDFKEELGDLRQEVQEIRRELQRFKLEVCVEISKLRDQMNNQFYFLYQGMPANRDVIKENQPSACEPAATGRNAQASMSKKRCTP